VALTKVIGQALRNDQEDEVWETSGFASASQIIKCLVARGNSQF
jgi:hypothetical protein